LDKKRFLSHALGGALGLGVSWLVFKKDPLRALSAAGVWLFVSAIMWLLERKKE